MRERIGGDIWNFFLGQQEADRGQLPRQEYYNRQALLNKVSNYWVKGVLEKSLHNQVFLKLGLEERPGAIATTLIAVSIDNAEHEYKYPS